MKKLFGTDGMRGEAGRFPLDAETIEVAAGALARHLAEEKGSRPRIVVGRDTRESGAWITAAFLRGARAGGALCESAGVITTPGVAFLTRSLPAEAGVVISASHNPFHDNGIKIFSPTGRKLEDRVERLIEADIYASRADVENDESARQRESTATAEAEDVSVAPGTETSADASAEQQLGALYLDYLAEEVGRGLKLDGLRVVVDCANGAASSLAPALLKRLGASVVAINHTPDGRNINRDCGSLHIEGLQRRVFEEDAALGVAYDGDADRALFVDGRGRLVDGDATLWVMAAQMHSRGQLARDTVVATVMSNIGLELALKTRGIKLLRAAVGDKYVLDELLRTGARLGGEQSGHIIFPDISLAGDGLITTLLLLRALTETGRTLDELTEGFTRYPQVLLNVPVREKIPFEEVPEIAARARAVEAKLGDGGRLLLRYSGTEALARVMIEGERQEEVEQLAHSLVDVIRASLGSD